MRFYVYVYQDPRKPGKYKYGPAYTFKYEPFYVGKGVKTRIREHLKEAFDKKRGRNSKKCSLIKEIMQEKEPIITEFGPYKEEDALAEESLLIELIGRRHNKEGSLTNMRRGSVVIPKKALCKKRKIKNKYKYDIMPYYEHNDRYQENMKYLILKDPSSKEEFNSCARQQQISLIHRTYKFTSLLVDSYKDLIHLFDLDDKDIVERLSINLSSKGSYILPPYQYLIAKISSNIWKKIIEEQINPVHFHGYVSPTKYLGRRMVTANGEKFDPIHYLFEDLVILEYNDYLAEYAKWIKGQKFNQRKRNEKS